MSRPNKPKTKPATYRLPTDTITRIKTMASLHRLSEAEVIDFLVHGIPLDWDGRSPVTTSSSFGHSAVTWNTTPNDTIPCATAPTQTATNPLKLVRDQAVRDVEAQILADATKDMENTAPTILKKPTPSVEMTAALNQIQSLAARRAQLATQGAFTKERQRHANP